MKADEKFCVTFLLCDPGWYVHLMSRMNGKKTHTHRKSKRSLATCKKLFLFKGHCSRYRVMGLLIEGIRLSQDIT